MITCGKKHRSPMIFSGQKMHALSYKYVEYVEADFSNRAADLGKVCRPHWQLCTQHRGRTSPRSAECSSSHPAAVGYSADVLLWLLPDRAGLYRARGARRCYAQ